AMTKFAVKVKPDWSCLVPEKRNEVTTEGGLDLKKTQKRVAPTIAKLEKAGIRVSLFVEPSEAAMKLSHELGADAVELHTGRFCMAAQGAFKAKSAQIAKTELERVVKAAKLARKLGLKVHAGHGFDYENVRQMAFVRDDAGALLIEEYNIGHVIVCRAAI